MKNPTMVVLVLVTSCQSPNQVTVCSDIEVQGIRVTAKDSISGQALQGGLIRVVANDATYADTVETTNGSLIKLVGERPGTYAVTITAGGYQAWLRNNVEVVMADACHVRPVTLTALMQH